MKHILCALLIGLLCLSAAASAEGAYPCYVDEPFAYAASEFTIESGERSIYGQLYLPEGEGPFPTVIMSHGFNGSEGSWAFTANAFASSGFACYAYDFCGGNTLGRSSGKTSEMSALTEKEDLLTVMDAISAQNFCDTDRLFLMGESLGGLVTALVDGERSNAVRGVVLFYPAFSSIPLAQESYASVDEIPARLRFSGVPIGLQFYGDLLDLDLDAILAACESPALILHGDADELVPLSSSEDAAEKLPNAQLNVLSGEGHGFSTEGKTIASQLSWEFLSGLL